MQTYFVDIDTGIPSCPDQILSRTIGYMLPILPEELGQPKVY